MPHHRKELLVLVQIYLGRLGDWGNGMEMVKKKSYGQSFVTVLRMDTENIQVSTLTRPTNSNLHNYMAPRIEIYNVSLTVIFF